MIYEIGLSSEMEVYEMVYSVNQAALEHGNVACPAAEDVPPDPTR